MQMQLINFGLMLIEVKVKMEERDQYNLNAGNISFFICCAAWSLSRSISMQQY